MKIKFAELANGDCFLFDEDHPHRIVASFLLSRGDRADLLRHVAEHLRYDINQLDVLRALERAKTTEAQAERKAIHEFLRKALESYGPFNLVPHIDHLFEAMDEHQAHHRYNAKKREGDK